MAAIGVSHCLFERNVIGGPVRRQPLLPERSPPPNWRPHRPALTEAAIAPQSIAQGGIRRQRPVMYTYIIRRMAFGALTIVGVSVVVFMVLRVLPGDPLVAIFGPEGFTKLSEADRAGYMAQLG